MEPMIHVFLTLIKICLALRPGMISRTFLLSLTQRMTPPASMFTAPCILKKTEPTCR